MSPAVKLNRFPAKWVFMSDFHAYQGTLEQEKEPHGNLLLKCPSLKWGLFSKLVFHKRSLFVRVLFIEIFYGSNTYKLPTMYIAVESEGSTLGEFTPRGFSPGGIAPYGKNRRFRSLGGFSRNSTMAFIFSCFEIK
jgi:hypothetical protein